MEPIDVLGRRKRHSNRAPNKNVRLQPRDVAIFYVIHRHGWLSTSYIYQLTKHIASDYTGLQKRLRDLTHSGHLHRPKFQWNTRYNNNDVVYSNAPPAKDSLKAENLWSDNAPTMRPSVWQHDLMVSHASASLEIGAMQAGVTYIPHHFILNRADTTLTVPDVEGHDLEPDRLGGFNYSNDPAKGKFLFFTFEGDRNTENIGDIDNPDDGAKRKTKVRNVRQYQALLYNTPNNSNQQKRYQQHYKLKAGMVCLTLTTTQASKNAFLDVTKELSPRGKNSYMNFRVEESFGDYFKIPKPMTELFFGDWHRAGYEPFNLSKLA